MLHILHTEPALLGGTFIIKEVSFIVPLNKCQQQHNFSPPPAHFCKSCCRWRGDGVWLENPIEEGGEEEWRMQTENTKRFFKAPLLLCNNLSLSHLFSFSCKSTPGKKTQDYPINNERRRNYSSWLGFNKSAAATSPSGLGRACCTWHLRYL